ncbi:MAG: hypothetical protein NTZ16_06360 [Verrucomicrobia bacterium]|nr:hypothetical protein [Verrucomicrobiota bacterium]
MDGDQRRPAPIENNRPKAAAHFKLTGSLRLRGFLDLGFDQGFFAFVVGVATAALDVFI